MSIFLPDGASCDGFDDSQLMPSPGGKVDPVEPVSEIVSEITKIFAEVLEVPVTAVGVTDRLYEDLEGESLQKLEIIVAVEKRFNVRFPAEQGALMESVEDFAEAIASIQ
jgi:acyl carrier protein